MGDDHIVYHELSRRTDSACCCSQCHFHNQHCWVVSAFMLYVLSFFSSKISIKSLIYLQFLFEVHSDSDSSSEISFKCTLEFN